MQRTRSAGTRLHPRVPRNLQNARAQNAPPQVVSQSTPATQAALPQTEGESAAWRGTLARVAESVVAIEIDQTRAFDTEWNASAQATGFVVDAERGLILTNRHVVTPGPVTSEATFLNREEVQLYPGIPRSHPRLRHLSLRPEEAALHQAALAAAVSGRRADRPRDPRHRQQRRRAALDPRGHARQARSRRARIRHRQVQRLQHLLSAGRIRHVGWFLGFARHRHPGSRGCAQRRWRDRRRVQLLSTAGAREARARSHPGGQGRAARRAAGGVPLHAVR